MRLPNNFQLNCGTVKGDGTASNIRDLQSIQTANLSIFAKLHLPNCQTKRQMSGAHIIPTQTATLLQVAMPSSYLWSHSSRLGRLWKCQRTSRRQRRGRTRSSARWTRTWTANSHSRSLLRFGRVPFLCISFVHGYVSDCCARRLRKNLVRIFFFIFARVAICAFFYVKLLSKTLWSHKSFDKYHACLVKVCWEGEFQQKAALRSWPI